MMTEQEAWLKLAEIFGREDAPGTGMCYQIYHRLTISPETHAAMTRKIKAAGTRTGRTFYLYSIDFKGHKKRVAFCHKQAEALDVK